jgi:hypothetical protein
MKDLRLLPLAVSVFAIASGCADQSTVKEHDRQLRDINERVQALEAKLAARATVDSVELQERCARQSAQVSRAMGYNPQSALGGYENHFNTKLGKCFILVTIIDMKTEPGALLTSVMLADAYESREYANFMSKSGGVPWGEPYCTVSPLGKEQQQCRSRGEFDAFVRPFMTE